jgi:hypothetical protein
MTAVALGAQSSRRPAPAHYNGARKREGGNITSGEKGENVAGERTEENMIRKQQRDGKERSGEGSGTIKRFTIQSEQFTETRRSTWTWDRMRLSCETVKAIVQYLHLSNQKQPLRRGAVSQTVRMRQAAASQTHSAAISEHRPNT